MAVKHVVRSKEQPPAKIEREVDLLSSVDHPNIVHYLGHERTHDSVYIFMEYLPYDTLSDVCLQLGRPMPEELCQHYLRQILSVMRYLHEDLRVVHRDLKGKFGMDDVLTWGALNDA